MKQQIGEFAKEQEKRIKEEFDQKIAIVNKNCDKILLNTAPLLELTKLSQLGKTFA